MRAEALEGAGQVNRAGGFTDAAFAAGDSDDAVDAGHSVLLGQRALRAGSGWLARGHFHLDVDHLNFGKRLEDAFAIVFELLSDLRIRRGQLQSDADGAVIGSDVLDQPKGDDVPGVAGIFDGLEGVGDGLLS